MDRPTKQLTGVGAKDAYASKNSFSLGWRPSGGMQTLPEWKDKRGFSQRARQKCWRLRCEKSTDGVA